MVRREPASLLITLRQSLCLWRQYTLYTGLGTKRFIAIVFVTFRCRNIAKKTQNSFKNFGQKTKRIVADPIPHYCIHDNLGSLLCSCSIQQSSCYTCYTEDSCRPAIIDSCQKQLSQISFHALSFQKI